MNDLIDKGIQEGLIKISDDGKTIKYANYPKPRNFVNPEEKVQADAFLRLVLEYNYPVEHIKQFVSISSGSGNLEADIVVYTDAQCNKPKIIVECKKQDVSQQEFAQAEGQAFSYANLSFATMKFVWIYSGMLSKVYRYNKEKETREPLSGLPHYGSDEVAPHSFVKGGGKHTYIDGSGKIQTQDFSDIKRISESELTKRFKQAHDALWAGGQLNPSEAFDELDKLIFCKIWDERYNTKGGNLKRRKKGEIYDFQIITIEGKNEEDTIQKTNKALSERIRAIYKAGKTFDKEVFKDDIRLTPERIRTIVEYLQEINLSDTDLDSKGRAFETFMGSFFRGEFGQYFTPRTIVQFIVEALPIKNTSLVLDTSCGSGGFLLHALDKVRRQADKEFPDYETDKDDFEGWKEYWHNFAQNKLYGIEINEQIARTAKMNMIIHDDGHTNVIAVDGLLNFQDVFKFTSNRGFEYGRFNFIITNPPFGSTVKQKEKAYLKRYFLGNKEPDWLDYKNTKTEVRNNQNTEVLFIEQCYNYLAENGYLAIVLPDGILTNSSMQYVRDAIEDWYRLVAIVSIPQTAFSATGAGVKSSVMFLRKYKKEQTENLKNLKLKIQNQVKAEFDYINQINNWDVEKKQKIASFDGFPNPNKLKTAKEKKESAEFKEWKLEVNQYYNELLADLQERMRERYQQEKVSRLDDYSIFMAIAENIGYDAAGKSTSILVSKNEIIEGRYMSIVEHLSHDLFDEKVTREYALNDDKEELSTKREILKAGILKELDAFITAVEHGRV